MTYRYNRLFDTLTSDDVAAAGSRNASLGELYRELRPKGVLVPNGFVTTCG